MKEPKFWYASIDSLPATKRLFLLLLSSLFDFFSGLKKLFTKTHKVTRPVICIGNLTVGGAGKTPTTLAIANHLKDHGKKVAIISRGYKGSLKGPLQVDPQEHTVHDVGDEPLLMSHYHPAWISANRYKGAKAAIKNGAEVILLDDGLQHHTLKQDLKICVVNTTQKFGNGQVLPLGPLRENLQKGLSRVDAIIAISNTEESHFYLKTEKALLNAQIIPNTTDTQALNGKKLIAFAGIAHPDKFFETLRLQGLNVKKKKVFSDHYNFTSKDLEELKQRAQDQKATLVTTQKDWVRLPKDDQELVSQVQIALDFKDQKQLKKLLAPFVTEAK